MIKHHLAPIVLAVSIATFPLASISTAQAKQPCSAAADQRGYWSWRIIDGRKCWYEGKPMLSKSLLEWPAKTSAPAVSSTEPTGAVTETRSDPLDAQAWVPPSDTFEALWRERIERH